jgi:hypothetical protein
MNTTHPADKAQAELSQADADALELAYPMHGEIVRDLLSRAEREDLARAEAAHQAWLMGEVLA